ncbi:hypothetical protein [Variovorax paradoxus]|uniref:hypothetical protein n=1 Tax=Variovorax paradoxus TaxID=34073 RepID=UPI003ECFBA96
MNYNVIVDADGASPQQVESARHKYLEVLESHLGGESQVLACFRSWSLVKDKGAAAVHDSVNSESAAWILADGRARAEAVELLSQATRVQFLFTLR